MDSYYTQPHTPYELDARDRPDAYWDWLADGGDHGETAVCIICRHEVLTEGAACTDQGLECADCRETP